MQTNGVRVKKEDPDFKEGMDYSVGEISNTFGNYDSFAFYRAMHPVEITENDMQRITPPCLEESIDGVLNNIDKHGFLYVKSPSSPIHVFKKEYSGRAGYILRFIGYRLNEK